MRWYRSKVKSLIFTHLSLSLGSIGSQSTWRLFATSRVTRFNLHIDIVGIYWTERSSVLDESCEFITKTSSYLFFNVKSHTSNGINGKITKTKCLIYIYMTLILKVALEIDF